MYIICISQCPMSYLFRTLSKISTKDISAKKYYRNAYETILCGSAYNSSTRRPGTGKGRRRKKLTVRDIRGSSRRGGGALIIIIMKRRSKVLIMRCNKTVVKRMRERLDLGLLLSYRDM